MQTPTRVIAFWALLLSILGIAAFGYLQGTPQDIINAVRSGDLEDVSVELARDPTRVHTKVFPQAYERLSQQQEYMSRHGQSPWKGRYLIHDALARGDVRILEALARAGADLAVRIEGRSLLHIAARDGDIKVATWLLDRGADVQAANDCQPKCTELNQTPLHDAQAFRDDEMSALLLARGALVDAVDANGRSALHFAGGGGKLGGAFVLCRYGADPARQDAAEKTPYDLALARLAHEATLTRGLAEDEERPQDYGAMLVEWLKPQGGCATVAAAARAIGSPISDEDARKVFAETVPR